MRSVTSYLRKLCKGLSYKVTGEKKELVMLEVGSFQYTNYF